MAASDDVKFQFRRIVSEAAQKLSAKDRRTLVYVYDLPVDDKDKDGISILSNLQMRGKFSNPEGLLEVLRVAGRADLVKDIEKKWRKVREKQDRETTQKATASASELSSKTDTLSLMKKKFDEIVEQAADLVEQVTRLGEEMKQKSDGRHRKAHEMLVECEEKADAVKRSLKQARSAAELSDRALAVKEHLQSRLDNAVQGMSNSDMQKKVEALESGKSAPSHSPLAHIATPTPGRARDAKKPLFPLPRARALSSIDREPELTYYDSNDLLKNKPHLRAEQTKPPPPARRRLNSDSEPDSEPKCSKSKPPVPVPRQRDFESKIPHWTPANHPSKRRMSLVTKPHQYENVTPEEMYDKDDNTEGSTGDSGFGGDAASLLKAPLKSRYTPLQPPQREVYEEAEYETLQQ